MIGGIPALLLSCSKKKSHPKGSLIRNMDTGVD